MVYTYEIITTSGHVYRYITDPELPEEIVTKPGETTYLIPDQEKYQNYVNEFQHSLRNARYAQESSWASFSPTISINPNNIEAVRYN